VNWEFCFFYHAQGGWIAMLYLRTQECPGMFPASVKPPHYWWELNKLFAFQVWYWYGAQVWIVLLWHILRSAQHACTLPGPVHPYPSNTPTVPRHMYYHSGWWSFGGLFKATCKYDQFLCRQEILSVVTDLLADKCRKASLVVIWL